MRNAVDGVEKLDGTNTSGLFPHHSNHRAIELSKKARHIMIMET